MTEKQLGWLSYKARMEFKERLPDAWKDAGEHPGRADYRITNFEKWCRANLTTAQASTVIDAFGNFPAAGMHALKKYGCPIV